MAGRTNGGGETTGMAVGAVGETDWAGEEDDLVALTGEGSGEAKLASNLAEGLRWRPLRVWYISTFVSAGVVVVIVLLNGDI